MVALRFWQLLVTLLVVYGAEGVQFRARVSSAASLAVQTPLPLINAVSPERPHILFILIDDLGWAEVEWNRETPTNEIQTPNMKALASEGTILEHHYVHKFCSPTRSAIQSGRAPIHVNLENLGMDLYNPDDPISGFSGIPRNMTCIASLLREAGYSTHMVGKWDAGGATPDHTPAGRGYDTSLVYFNHASDCWTLKSTCNAIDLWNMYGDIQYPGEPAVAWRNVDGCHFKSQKPGGQCVFEDQIFEERVKLIIDSRNDAKPLFIFWSLRSVHGAQQPPDDTIAAFSFIDDVGRKRYRSMVNWLDGAVGRVVDSLKTNGLYEDTLIVLSTDNGVPTYEGSNYPLRGGKASNFEGGIRAASFVSGGFLPGAVRGTKQTHLIASWDWYATFAGLAGIDPTDRNAERAGLPPIDSIDQWPLLSGVSGQINPPRTQLEIGTGKGVGGLIVQRPAHSFRGRSQPAGLYKILVGSSSLGGWSGPDHNATPVGHKKKQMCGFTPETGCVFNVEADPGEHENLAAELPELYQELLNKVHDVNRTVFSPVRGSPSPKACEMAKDFYGGYWGPFIL